MKVGFLGWVAVYFLCYALITLGITFLCYQISESAGYSAARWWFWVSIVGAWISAKRKMKRLAKDQPADSEQP